MGFYLGGLENQCLLFGGGGNIVEVGDVFDQSFELAATIMARFLKIGTHSTAQIFGLANINGLSFMVLHEVHTWFDGQGIEFKAQMLGDGLFHLAVVKPFL